MTHETYAQQSQESRERALIHAANIIAEEASWSGVPIEEIMNSDSNVPKIAHARHVALWRCFHETGLSKSQLAKLFEVRRHALWQDGAF